MVTSVTSDGVRSLVGHHTSQLFTTPPAPLRSNPTRRSGRSLAESPCVTFSIITIYACHQRGRRRALSVEETITLPNFNPQRPKAQERQTSRQMDGRRVVKRGVREYVSRRPESVVRGEQTTLIFIIMGEVPQSYVTHEPPSALRCHKYGCPLMARCNSCLLARHDVRAVHDGRLLDVTLVSLSLSGRPDAALSVTCLFIFI